MSEPKQSPLFGAKARYENKFHGYTKEKGNVLVDYLVAELAKLPLALSI
ncbi:hypothetical protein ACFOG5_20065 [Pedobacter fastidiosus]|uniref:Uncharacterized protein n=1 Tax=Pedobacter fastidiosus TaxID=2765361 RepID=A0ABR7KWV7_9SPHI|nr:hypothetical protein [Pedobacter fastidiosus]MBC6112237.1 hypothetical protein [Pedobacter fastidiosus]